MELQQLSHRILAGPRQGAGSQRWTRTIQDAFRSLTPEMSMRTGLERFQGSAISQLEDIQERVAAITQSIQMGDGNTGEMEWTPLSTRTPTPPVIREEAVLRSSLRTCNGFNLDTGKG